MKTKLFRAVPAYATAFLLLVVIPVFISLITGFDAPWLTTILKAVFSWKAFLLLSMLTLGVCAFQVRGIGPARASRVLEKLQYIIEKLKAKVHPPISPIEVPVGMFCQVMYEEAPTVWRSFLSQELSDETALLIYEGDTGRIYAQLDDDQCHLFLGDRHIQTLCVGDIFQTTDTEYIKFI